MLNSFLFSTGGGPGVDQKFKVEQLRILFGPSITIIHVIEIVGQMLKSIVRLHCVLDCINQEMNLFFQFDLEKSNCSE